MRKQIYVTFDVERDYTSVGYCDPVDYSGIRFHIPRILDLMKSEGVIGTFFLTSEVIRNNEDLVNEIKHRHVLGVHMHVYPHDGFIRNDDFRNYGTRFKLKMVNAEIKTWSEHTLPFPAPFRIGQLSPDWTVLRAAHNRLHGIDSSFHVNDFNFGDRIATKIYGLHEFPVTAYLAGWAPTDFISRFKSVLLVHPLTPPTIKDHSVYDEQTFRKVLQMQKDEFEYLSL